MEDNIIEVLEKAACVRCGKPNMNGTKGGRCKSCMDKLSSKRQKPGSKERAAKHADQALRRERGGKGTTTGGHAKGHGNRKAIQDKMQRAEKKTGQKLSADRKNNESGYAASNTRAIPEKLNRGRHKADPKKLSAWKKRLKKCGIELDDFTTILQAKALSKGDEALSKALDMLDVERMMTFYLSNAQKPSRLMKALSDEAGNTHTVEVHPDIDHLYRVKNMIQMSGKPDMHVNNIKKAGVAPALIDKIPRDSKGRISPEMIDKHIEGLPKQKVQATVMPYQSGDQKHRDTPQYIISAQMHPDQLAKLSDKEKEIWNHIKTQQHEWGGPRYNKKNLENIDQVGWVRVDPTKTDSSGAIVPHDHWHMDEIQSDFQNYDKMKERAAPDESDENRESLREKLSHGHADPQHMLHSVANALGRKLGVKSTSLDMPDDQAKQAHLQNHELVYPTNDKISTYQWNQQANNAKNQHLSTPEDRSHVWEKYAKPKIDEHMKEEPDFKSAAEKLGPANMKEFAELANDHEHGFMFDGVHGGERDDLASWISPNISENQINVSEELAKKMRLLSGDEQNALSTFLNQHHGNLQEHVADRRNMGARPAPNFNPRAPIRVEKEKPIHHIDTYEKRPKKLGMKPVDKDTVLGSDSEDPYKQIQYSELYKRSVEKV